ncbi:MAG: dTDP-4-dehydrorhamnose 3,5-epimerase [Fidelibacterota bacterium]
MKVEKTAIGDVLLITPVVHADARGYFFESYREEIYAAKGLPTRFVQDNQAASTQGVLRGLHYQLHFPQGKLVQVVLGTVYDVAVDIRRGSPTFGQYVGYILTEENHHQFYIPEGFAHGYCVISEQAVFQYKCTETYHPEDEYGIRWDDPEIAIDWPIENPLLSEKDASLPALKAVPTHHLPEFKA